MKKIAIGAITEYDAFPISNGRNHAMIGTFANGGTVLAGSLIGKEIITTIFPGKRQQMDSRHRTNFS